MKMKLISNNNNNNNGLEMGHKFLCNTISALDFVADSIKNDSRYKEIMETLMKCNTAIDSMKLENEVDSKIQATTINTCLYN